MSSPTFIDQVLAGDVLDPEKEIEARVAAWHASDSAEDLHDTLGMTLPEYALWVEKPKFLRAILMARATGADLQKLVSDSDDNLAMAARGVPSNELREVREWLKRTGRL